MNGNGYRAWIAGCEAASPSMPLARLAHGMDYGDAGRDGSVQFVVTMHQGPNRGRSTRLHRNWRTESPAAVCSALVEAYVELTGAI